MSFDKFEKYPSADEYQKTVEDYVRAKKMRKFLRSRHKFFVCIYETDEVADISRRLLFGHEDTDLLRSGARQTSTTERSTGFEFKSEDTKDDFVSEFNEAQRHGAVLDDDKQVTVKGVNERDDGVDLELQYEVSYPGRIGLLDSETKQTEVSFEETEQDDVWRVTQDYRKNDAFQAVRAFFDGINTRRLEDDDKDELQKVNITLDRLGTTQKIDLFDDILDYDHPNWDLHDVTGIEVQRDSEVDSVDDDALQGITNAALSGRSLRTNDFVQSSEESGYYFKAITLSYDHATDAKRMEISIEFKQKPKNTFDISIDREQEIRDGVPEPDTFDEDRQTSVRDSFRDMVIELYNQYIPETDADSDGGGDEEPVVMSDD